MARSTIRTRRGAWSLIASLFLATLFISSCGPADPRETPIPSEVLSQDTMVSILTDIHIVEGAKVGRSVIGDTLEVSVYYRKVFEKHGVTKEKFSESFDFYTQYPSRMQVIYDEVIENLNKIDLNPKREKLNDDDGESEKDTAKSIE